MVSENDKAISTRLMGKCLNELDLMMTIVMALHVVPTTKKKGTKK